MPSKPHRKSSKGIVFSRVCASALAYPDCGNFGRWALGVQSWAFGPPQALFAADGVSLQTARFNAAHLSVLNPIDQHRGLSQVVRANLAPRDPKTDGEMLVSL
jgi:hypothetical protein